MWLTHNHDHKTDLMEEWLLFVVWGVFATQRM